MDNFSRSPRILVPFLSSLSSSQSVSLLKDLYLLLFSRWVRSPLNMVYLVFSEPLVPIWLKFGSLSIRGQISIFKTSNFFERALNNGLRAFGRETGPKHHRYSSILNRVWGTIILFATKIRWVFSYGGLLLWQLFSYILFLLRFFSFIFCFEFYFFLLSSSLFSSLIFLHILSWSALREKCLVSFNRFITAYFCFLLF